jgi:hypothetical protein
VRGDLEPLFLLAFSKEEFLAALAMASSEAFFNKLLIGTLDVWKYNFLSDGTVSGT